VKSFSLIVLCFVSLLGTSALAQTEFYPKNTFDIRLLFGKSSGTSFCDLNGNTKFELLDKSLDIEQPKRNYIFEYLAYESGLRVEYAPKENLVLFSEIPIVYHSLNQRADTTIYRIKDTVNMTYDTLKYKKQIGDYTLLQPSYFSIGARYKIYSKLAYVAVTGELRIPPGFHNGIQNDPGYEFLSDGAFEIHTGIILGVTFEKSWLESSFSYHLRGEELVDYLQVHTEFGLSNVPGAKIGVRLDYLQSMGNFNSAVEFDPRKTTLQENALKAGFLFNWFLTDNFYIDFSFGVNLLGKNTLNSSGFVTGIGVRF